MRNPVQPQFHNSGRNGISRLRGLPQELELLCHQWAAMGAWVIPGPLRVASQPGPLGSNVILGLAASRRGGPAEERSPQGYP
jgi:hypothetical protein